jgi:cystinosin
LNFQRGTVAGLSFEFLALNLLGFSCYTVYNGGLYWNATIQAQYFAETHKTSVPVKSNDVFFGLHAVAVTLLTIIQCFTLKREAGQRLSFAWGMLALGLSIFIAVYAAVVATGHGGTENSWWFFALNISYVKLAISCCKYIPQVIINHRRRSTGGWSIHNVLLDFTGGLLSVVQQCGDAQATGDWGGV